jgi:hypothetical protein
MAAGVPATGIGGIYYILLTIGLLLHKIIKRIAAFFKKQSLQVKASHSKFKTLFPSLAFCLCISFLIFMNATGFRFTIPGISPVTVSLQYLWVIGAFSITMTIVFVGLVIFRSREKS